jgi:hypothetical protein
MKLSDTQRSLLEAAAKHPQKLLADFPVNLKGGALIKVLTALGNAELIAPHSKTPEGTTLFAITTAGLQSIGTELVVPGKQRDGTKQAVLIALLKRPEGATLSQMVEATQWQVHTVRGAMAGALKKKLGLEITSEKQTGTDSVYRITTTTV